MKDRAIHSMSKRIHKADDSVTITIKEKDRDFLFELIEMQGKAEELDEQNAKLKNQRIYKELKKSAEEKGEKL